MFLIIESWAYLYSSFLVLSSLSCNSKNSCFCLYIAWSFSHLCLALSKVSSNYLIFYSCSWIFKVLLLFSSSLLSFSCSTSEEYFFFKVSFYFVISLKCSLYLLTSFFNCSSTSFHLWDSTSYFSSSSWYLVSYSNKDSDVVSSFLLRSLIYWSNFY